MKLNRHLYINGNEVQLDDDEPIPITKQVNNIAELKDRNCDFTTDFKIPATRKNRKIFEHANLFSSQTFTPYVKNDCTYVEDGIELISNGYIVLLSSTDNYFNCAAYAGVADFFKLIDKLKLTSLNLNNLITTVNNTIFTQNLGDLRWLVFEPSKGGDGLSSGGTTIFNFRPFVKLQRLFRQIIEDQGWTLTGDFDKIKGWSVCPTLTPTLSDYFGQVSIVNPMQNTAVPYLNNSAITANGHNMILQKGRNTTYLLFHPRKGKYRYTISGKFLLNTAGTFNVVYIKMAYSGFANAYIETDHSTIASNTNFGTVQNFEVVYEYDCTEVNYNYALLFGAGTSDSTCTIYEFSIKAQLIESPVLYGDTITPASILPDMEQSKFLKSVANMFGLVFNVDSRRRTVNVWQFDRLLSNISKAKDWSNYLDCNDSTLSYRIGEYAQSNEMKYKEIEDVPKGYGDGSLYINDSTLENSKESFVLDFAACNDVLFKNKVISLIPVCEKEEGKYKNSDDKDARVVLDKAVTGAPFDTNDGSSETGNVMHVTTYQAAFFADVTLGQSLAFGFSLIHENYKALQLVLNKAKKLEVKMNIPAIEIQNLDHSIPVYLKQYQSYFYVNKVNGWTKRKKCSVELIKIA